MSDATDLPLGYEGRYRWVVFLPAVTHGLGVPNRYYGLYEHGEFKLRGIGGRRHDTTTLVRRFEGELLDLFRTARSPAEFRALVPRALHRADRFAEAVGAGGVAGGGARHHPPARPGGGGVRHVHGLGRRVAPARPRRCRAATGAEGPVRRPRPDEPVVPGRVRPEELIEGTERYDPGAYLDLLARAGETLLAPFGVDRDGLLERWGVGRPPERGRYRSPEGVGQSFLDGAAGSGATF